MSGLRKALMAAAGVALAAAGAGLATHSVAAGAVKTFKDCVACPDMVTIPAGAYMMGSPMTEVGRDADEALHKVTIAYKFAVSQSPITWDQWEECVRDGACKGQEVDMSLRSGRDGKPIQNYVDMGRGKRPVVGVNWYDAQAYVGWLNKKTKGGYRLLSESEFEYAARAGSTTVFWWGDAANHDYANYGKDDGAGLGGAVGGRDKWDTTTSPVGAFPVNPFGLYDMHGNVYTWIEDCYERDAAKLPADGSAQKDVGCRTRGLRSNSYESNPKTMRSANRAFPYTPDQRGHNYVGIRVAKTLK